MNKKKLKNLLLLINNMILEGKTFELHVSNKSIRIEYYDMDFNNIKTELIEL